MPDVWPVSLPQDFLRNSYQSAAAENRIRSQPDTGPAKVRRRSTANVRPMAGNMNITDAQLTALKTFYDTTTLSGSLPFTFPDPETAATLLVRFDGVPGWSYVSPDVWLVMLKLEVLP
jgi:hypothetical protein